MKENIMKEKNMDMVNKPGLMEITMNDNVKKLISWTRKDDLC